jgi:uncharacterized protein YkwD
VAAVALGGGALVPMSRAVLDGSAAQALADSVPAPGELTSMLGMTDNGGRNWLTSAPLRLDSAPPARLAGGRALDAGQVLAALVRAKEVERAQEAAAAAQRAAEAAAREAAAQAAAQAAAEQEAAARAEAERRAAEDRAAAERAEAERRAAEEAAAEQAAAEEAWRMEVERDRRAAERAAAAPLAADPAAGPTLGGAPVPGLDAGQGQMIPQAAPAALSAPAPVMAPVAAAPAVALDAAETQFLSLLNAQRAAVGLGPVAVDAGLVTSARAQAGRIASAGALSHQDLSPLLGRWNAAGENVGFGPDVSVINSALVNSPGHYANMVGTRFSHVGVGVVAGGDGRLWVAQVFGG